MTSRWWAAALAVAASGALGQSYPVRPIRFIVGFPAGGATDVAARAIGQKLSEAFGQSVVVDNRPGAASNIGAEAVAKSPPDGYTMLMGSLALSVNATLYGKLGYDALRDLAPITQVTNAPFMLVVHPSVPARTVKELIGMARARPGQLQYGSGGSGSGAHLMGELFRSTAGVDLQHIPYKGAAPAMNDVLGGQIPLTFDNILTTLPLHNAGKLRSLGVTTAKRSPSAPDIPTIAEAGVKGYDADSWFGMLVPSGTPASIVNRLHAETVKILKAPEMRDRLRSLGAEPVGSAPEEFGAFLRSEIAKWGKVVKAAGLRID